jgi:nanoRNase/pAp phosphatase (c-di-AMP/oligoRNAs hydrolase)
MDAVLEHGIKTVPLRDVVSELRTALEARRGEHHVIAIRGYPDPDSIGSAMAHSFICRAFDIEAAILYFDDISHQENRALVKKLSIDMVRYTTGMDLSQFDRLAIVDSQTVELPEEIEQIPVFSVVDHHKLQAETHADFIDIREDAGATCSIYAEYLASSLVQLEHEDPTVAKLTSALLYGIRSDTDNYLLAHEIDYRAAAFLAGYADHDLLLSISLQHISPRTMEITQRAYANKVIADTFLVSGVGYVRDEDRDSIGQAADYLLRREGIDTVMCYGIVNNQFVDGSLRTTSNVVEPDRFLKELFGTDHHGVFYGGGRADKGAFKIPLGPFARCSNRELLWQVVQSTIEELFLNKVGVPGASEPASAAVARLNEPKHQAPR